MSKISKKPNTHKLQFSDDEIYEQIKDQIRQLKQKGLKPFEEAQKIANLYNQHKSEKRKRNLLLKNNDSKLTAFVHSIHHKDSSDDEEGQISEKQTQKQENLDLGIENIPSISNLRDHIRPLTLTRNRIVDLLHSRRFQELVKGCFVRYLIESSLANNNSYIIAQIVGVAQGSKQYTVNNVKTKILLKLQETSDHVVTLALQLISNQHPPGGLEIQKWLQTNRNKIPKQKELQQKYEQHQKLLSEQLSSFQIDTNIWKKAKRIADEQQEPKQDITHLIDFVYEKLHNIGLTLQQLNIGRGKNQEGSKQKLERESAQAAQTLQRLKVVRQRYLTIRAAEKKSDPTKADKKYSWTLGDEKRKDEINERCKARYIMLSTSEGTAKLQGQIMQAHQQAHIVYP